MIGGYAAVARELNQAFAWPGKDGPVDRRQVEMWHKRRTANRAGQLAPSPAREVPQPRRSTPRYLFDTGSWVEWARPGVPGPRRSGWMVPQRGPDPRPQHPPHPRRASPPRTDWSRVQSPLTGRWVLRESWRGREALAALEEAQS